MKRIIKNDSPIEFEQWKNQYQLTESHLKLLFPDIQQMNETQKADARNKWNKDFSGKNCPKQKVKEELLKEQGKICCYCQKKINLDGNTQIEHFIARKNNPTKMFNYENLFACCDGGDKNRQSKREPKYCGSHKDDKTLLLNPLDVDCETHFSYEIDNNEEGIDFVEVKVKGTTEKGNDTISKLNLNTPKLCKLRGSAIAGFIYDENGDYISPDEVTELLLIIRQKQDNQFIAFCAVLESVLKNL